MDAIQQLRSEMISTKSEAVYLGTIAAFLSYLYRYEAPTEGPDDLAAPANENSDEAEARTHVNQLLGTQYVCPLASEARTNLDEFHAAKPNSSEADLRKHIKVLLKQTPPMAVIDFTKLTEVHFVRFVLSLTKANGTRPVFSTYNTHRAGFNHLFRIYRKTKPDAIEAELSIYFRSLKKRAARAAQDGLAPANSTKLPLPFEVYKTISSHLLKGTGVVNQEDSNTCVFGHLFWVLGWNTLSRSRNTQSISVNHMTWEADSLLVNICQAKNDQEGDNAQYPKHIYANPITPEVCVMLSLGIFFSLIRFSPTQTSLFSGNQQADRFRHFIQRLCDVEAVKLDLDALSFDKLKLGTHSIRKGAATYCASGTTAAPSQSAIDIRGGWSQGRIKDVYQHYQPAGDEYLGRVVSGLPRMAVEFAILPPHFKNSVSAAYLSDAVLSCFPSLPNQLKFVGQFALASLVYHADFLTSNLPTTHPIFHTYLFRNRAVLSDLKNLVICELPKSTSQITPTGIPPDILLAQMIRAVPGQIQSYLEERSILANSITPQGMRQALDEQYNRLCLLRQPAELQSPRLDGVDEHEDVPGQSTQAVRPLYYWKGKYRYLPETYSVPKVNLQIICQHWWFGDREKGIPPLRIVSAKDFKDRRRYADLKFVVNQLMKAANWSTQRPTVQQVNDMYETASRHIGLDELLGSRSGQVIWTTAVKKLRLNKTSEIEE